jgi:hypothetical protein
MERHKKKKKEKKRRGKQEGKRTSERITMDQVDRRLQTVRRRRAKEKSRRRK